MTVRQFLKECSNYEYSKERYDLMKECSELELMEQFISDQKYMKENVMNDSYYSESVDDESLVAIQESFKDRASNALVTIIEKLQKLVGKILSILSKFIPALKKAEEDFHKSKISPEKIFAAMFSDKEGNAITDVLDKDKSVDKYLKYITITKGSSYGRGLAENIEKKYLLVYAEKIEFKENNEFMPIKIKELVQSVDKVSKLVLSKKKDMSSKISLMIQEIFKGGGSASIDITSEALSKDIDQLNKLKESLDNIIDKIKEGEIEISSGLNDMMMKTYDRLNKYIVFISDISNFKNNNFRKIEKIRLYNLFGKNSDAEEKLNKHKEKIAKKYA